MKFLVFILIVSLAIAASAEDRCPTVYDGLTNGQFDLSTQFSTSAISANWYGLESNQILAYDWAVVSESQYTSAFDEACRTFSGFAGMPDTMQWRSVKKDTSAVVSTLELESSKNYYVVIRTTLTNGKQLFSNSNGILVLPEDLQKEFLEFSTKKVSEIRSEEESNRYTFERDSHESSTSTCEIDEANRCRQANVPVSQILADLYGPATFSDDSQLSNLFLFASTPAGAAAIGAAVVGPPIDDDSDDDSNDDDDDDDDGGALVSGILAIIVVAILLICCLLLCLILLLGFFISRGDDDDKFSERVVDRKTDFVDEAYGTHTDRVIETDDTRVEFPDIDPHSSLSVAD